MSGLDRYIDNLSIFNFLLSNKKCVLSISVLIELKGLSVITVTPLRNLCIWAFSSLTKCDN